VKNMQQEILNKKSDGYKSHAEGITRIPDRVRWFDSETFKLISLFFDEVELHYFFRNNLELEKRKGFCIEYE
jgi:hypothetical protein